MASRLFRAIVGVGISLAGANAAACAATTAHAIDDEDAAPTGVDPAKKNDATANADVTSADVTAPPKEDASTEDATLEEDVVVSVDASADVAVDAFCDAPWPTTKGNVGPRCYPKVADHMCGLTAGTPAACGGAVWVCAVDEIYAMDCWCWGASVPDGSACTDAGFQFQDAATDGG